MKIAIATRDYTQVSGHAGQTRQWLLYDLSEHRSSQLLPAPQFVELTREQILHTFEDKEAHPLDGVDIVVAASAGDGFIRHMKRRGCEVLLTGEDDPTLAISRILAGEALPDTRFDLTTTLCKLRDLFSRY
ncbi:MAG: NifB/NifX family molybdenum-iron cluster-binding protein [Bacteroidota bacterium]